MICLRILFIFCGLFRSCLTGPQVWKILRALVPVGCDNQVFLRGLPIIPLLGIYFLAIAIARLYVLLRKGWLLLFLRGRLLLGNFLSLESCDASLSIESVSAVLLDKVAGRLHLNRLRVRFFELDQSRGLDSCGHFISEGVDVLAGFKKVVGKRNA